MDTKNLTTKSNTEMVTISRAEYEQQQTRTATLEHSVTELKAENQWLLEQLGLARRRQFGPSSEKSSEEIVEQMSLFFNEAEATAAAEQAAQKKAVSETKVRAHTRKNSGSVRSIVPKDIPVEVVHHDVSPEEKVCPQCGEEMVKIGQDVRETLVFKPAEAYIRQDVYPTYGCRKCEKENISTPIVKTPRDPAVIPGSFASAEAVAFIAAQKFVMYAPLYRQEMDWKRRGIQITRQTMSNWLIRCSEDWFAPIYDVLHRVLLEYDLLHSDETSLQVLKEPGKKAQSKSSMWLYRTSGDAKKPIVLYEYQPDKGGDNPRKFLEGFRGYLQTDGAQYYNAVANVVHVACWAHARRKFEEAYKANPGTEEKPSPAAKGLALVSCLFKDEQLMEELTPEERKDKRLEWEKPHLDALLAWANTVSAAPKSRLGRALTYLRNNWQPLNTYLEDGRIELSNNRAERSIKPFVMGRKNWLFSNTPAGARSSAVIYSLIETAKENRLDPYRYMCWVLQSAPSLSRVDENWAEKLLPWMAPDWCTAQKKSEDDHEKAEH